MPNHHSLGGHNVHHGVSLPLMLDQPIDDNFYHDQGEPHSLDERMMNNFRPGGAGQGGGMGNFNQNRLQFDQMNQ